MILVTGASGQLGTLIVHALLKTTPAGEIVAGVRSLEEASALQALGVQVRALDYDQPATIAKAMQGVTKVVLISSTAIGKRVAQHRAVIDAAQQAGISLLAYTSLLHAETSTLILAPEHFATEQALKASGIPYVLLRNGWYFENQTGALGAAVAHGAILGAAGEGRFAAAARADFAAAAAVVMTSSGHENKVYELAGDEPYTYAELAAETARQSGKPVVYNNLPPDALKGVYMGFGLPEEVANVIVDGDLGAVTGQLNDSSHDLSKLIGRPTETLASAVKAALRD